MDAYSEVLAAPATPARDPGPDVAHGTAGVAAPASVIPLTSSSAAASAALETAASAAPVRPSHSLSGLLVRHGILVAVDAVAIALATCAVLLASPHDEQMPLAAIAFGAVALAGLAGRGQYARGRHAAFLDDLPSIVYALALAALGVTVARWAAGAERHAPDAVVQGWVAVALALVAGRAALRAVQLHYRRRGDASMRTLIVGTGDVAYQVAQRLRERSDLGLAPVGFVDDVDRLPSSPPPGAPPVWGSTDRLEDLVRGERIEHVIVGFCSGSDERCGALIRRCHELGVAVSHIPRLYECYPDRSSVERIGGLPLVSMTPGGHHRRSIRVKYALARVLGAVLLALSAPLMAPIALAVLLTMGRPVLFRQQRMGLDGQRFEMLKFRTMRPGAAGTTRVAVPDGCAPGGVEAHDRRTRVGTFLRRSSLDELPQLINVVRGQMTLVGPRPERPEFVRRFVSDVYRYGDRHRVKAGITGWAQVQGSRGQTPIAERVELDNYYIENWSLWLDFKILVLTVGTVLLDRPE